MQAGAQQASCCVRRSGDVLMRGKATYTEVFSAGSGNRYVSGFQGQLNIKHDGSGSFLVDPMTGALHLAAACALNASRKHPCVHTCMWNRCSDKWAAWGSNPNQTVSACMHMHVSCMHLETQDRCSACQ